MKRNKGELIIDDVNYEFGVDPATDSGSETAAVVVDSPGAGKFAEGPVSLTIFDLDGRALRPELKGPTYDYDPPYDYRPFWWRDRGRAPLPVGFELRFGEPPPPRDDESDLSKRMRELNVLLARVQVRDPLKSLFTPRLMFVHRAMMTSKYGRTPYHGMSIVVDWTTPDRETGSRIDLQTRLDVKPGYCEAAYAGNFDWIPRCVRETFEWMVVHEVKESLWCAGERVFATELARDHGDPR